MDEIAWLMDVVEKGKKMRELAHTKVPINLQIIYTIRQFDFFSRFTI